MGDRNDFIDIFDTSLSSLFSIPPIAFSTTTSNALHTYIPPINLGSIQIQLPQPPANLFTKLQANHLWLAAIYLADLICSGDIIVKDFRLAELGAGAGLPGIVACKQGAKVVSTDWGVDEVLGVIRDNFQRSCGSDQWIVIGHQWGTDIVPLITALSGNTPSLFDILLLADTVWVTEAHSALLDSIFALLKPEGMAYITAGLHTGRGPLERFISSAQQRGANINRIREMSWRADGGWDLHRSTDSTLEEERGVVVYFTLKTPKYSPG